VIDAPLALALTAGMVSTVNPCGFAMLPAYLAWFVSDDSDSDLDLAQRLGRALGVIAAVAAGFTVVFAVIGTLFQAGVRIFIDYVPWAALLIGAGVLILGMAMLIGWQPKWRVPQPNTGAPSDRGYRSMMGFGMTYGIASLSCTLPVFLSIVAGTATRSSWLSGLAALVAYVLGMTLVLAVATLSLAVAKHSMLTRLRQVSRHVNRLAALLLIASGGFIVYYWGWTLTTDVSTTTGYGPIRFLEGQSSWFTEAIANNRNTIALIGALAIAASAWALVVARGPQAPAGESAHQDDSAHQ